MVYHHFAEPSKVTKALARLLRPGGVLLAADWQPASSSTTGRTSTTAMPLPASGIEDHVVTHACGYSETDVKTILEAGGLVLDVYNSNVGEYPWRDQVMKPFVAKAVNQV
jgi:SAM-dependent methyltransferase